MEAELHTPELEILENLNEITGTFKGGIYPAGNRGSHPAENHSMEEQPRYGRLPLPNDFVQRKQF